MRTALTEPAGRGGRVLARRVLEWACGGVVQDIPASRSGGRAPVSDASGQGQGVWQLAIISQTLTRAAARLLSSILCPKLCPDLIFFKKLCPDWDIRSTGCACDYRRTQHEHKETLMIKFKREP